MKGQSKSRFLLALVILLAIFGAMFLRINAIAKSERAQIQSEMADLQQNIGKHISANYDTELEFMDQLMIQDDYNVQKIKFEVLDEMIQGLNEADALEKARIFLGTANGTTNIYSTKNGQPIKTLGAKIFYVAPENLNPFNGEDRIGVYQAAENPIKETLTQEEKSVLYYYHSKNQPWLLVTNKIYENQPQMSKVTENVLGSADSQVVSKTSLGVPKVYDELTFILLFVTSIGVLFAFAVILLIHRNYLYFIENQQMEDETP